MDVRKDIWRGPLNLGTEAGTIAEVVKEGTTVASQPYNITTPGGNRVYVDVEIHRIADLRYGIEGRVEGTIRFGHPDKPDNIVYERFNLVDGAPLAPYTSGTETVTLEHLSSGE